MEAEKGEIESTLEDILGPQAIVSKLESGKKSPTIL